MTNHTLPQLYLNLSTQQNAFTKSVNSLCILIVIIYKAKKVFYNELSCLGADGSLGKATKCTALGKQSIVVSLTVSTAEGGKQVTIHNNVGPLLSGSWKRVE